MHHQGSAESSCVIPGQVSSRLFSFALTVVFTSPSAAWYSMGGMAKGGTGGAWHGLHVLVFSLLRSRRHLIRATAGVRWWHSLTTTAPHCRRSSKTTGLLPGPDSPGWDLGSSAPR